MKFNFKKIILFAACLLPVGYLVYGFFTDNLGAEPIEFILRSTGLWILRLLLITLSITTIRKLFKFNLVNYRRMLGLFAFFYMVLHFSIYLVFEHSLDIIAVFKEITTQKHIFIGFLAFLLFIPLAITSTKGWMKRLKKKWVALHKSTYIIIIFGLLHFFWTVKSDISEPLIYMVLFAIVLLLRKINVNQRKSKIAKGV